MVFNIEILPHGVIRINDIEIYPEDGFWSYTEPDGWRLFIKIYSEKTTRGELLSVSK